MSRKKKNKNKLNIKLVTISIIVMIFIICFVYNIIALFVNPSDTFLIENGKISESDEVVGYLIREEKSIEMIDGAEIRDFEIKIQRHRPIKFGITYDKWIAAIENTVAPKFVEMNKKAFDLGFNS